MTYLLLMVMVLGGDVSVDNLIVQLGNDSYEVRATAAQQLMEIGHPALEKLKVAKESPDMDTAIAADMIIRHYYLPLRWPHQPIWYLPKQFRYAGDTDLAEHYYRKALDLERTKGELLTDSYWRYDDVELNATRLLFADMLSLGDKQRVEIIHDGMWNIYEVCSVIRRVEYTKLNGNPYEVPLPIEDLLVNAHLDWSETIHGRRIVTHKVLPVTAPEPEADELFDEKDD